MKNLKTAGVILLVVIALQACNSGSYTSEKVETNSDSLSYMLGLSIGNSLKKDKITDIKPSLIAKGINEVMNNDTTVSEMAINTFLNNYFRLKQEEQTKKNVDEGNAYLASNKSKDGVIVTASGLQYKVIQEGTGKTPTAADNVKCHYKGTLISGEVFDSSYDRGEPAEFPVSGVIPGWTEALQLMKEGGKYELCIPSELAYGPRGAGGKIGPNSVLVFEIELLEVKAGE